MRIEDIQKNVQSILSTLPEHVTLEAAAKTRTAEEAQAAVDAGISVLGYNYVQEAEKNKNQLNVPVQWHLIGHLQKNKVNKAVRIFDLIETIDSLELAEQVNTACEKVGKIMPIFIEVNSGRETRKAGIAPNAVEPLAVQIADLPCLKLQGLMTMGPWVDNPEELRPYFSETRTLFEHLIKLNIINTELKHVSMGMSNSYKVAIEEGATIVRLGSILFGPRNPK